MPSRLHALLVGINAYPPPGRPLKGCVRDAETLAAYLCDSTAGTAVIEVLLDAEATRSRILETFRRHLGQARAGDVALFAYSGHGSREYAPPPYDAEEPGGLSETLVAYDSREEGRFDIADKELAALIGEVESRGAHVVVILDSCYAGTATRDGDAVRQYERGHDPRYRQRPAGTYWFEDPAAVPGGLVEAGGWRVLPRGPHVLLAACQEYQTARETEHDGKPCGLFSLLLLESLESLPRPLSYRQWFKDIEARALRLNPNQLPQGRGDLDRLVFDGTTARRAVTFHLTARHGSWELDAGYLHGLRQDSELAVFPAGTADLRALSAGTAVVRLSEVGAARSRIEVREGTLPEPPVGALPGVLTHLPYGRFGVAVDPELPDRSARRELVRRIESSPLLEIAEVPERAAVQVRRGEHRDDPWRLARPGEEPGIPLPAEARKGWPARAVGALEQMARWQTLANLEPPQGASPLQVEMTLLRQVRPPAPGGEPELEPLPRETAVLPYRDGLPGRFSVRLENRGDLPLHCALFDLTESFAIKRLETSGGERLKPGEQVVLRPMDGIPAIVPEGAGHRRRDLLLLLASEDETDFSLLAQGTLFEAWSHRERPAGKPLSVLEALLWGIGHRELDGPGADRPLWALRWGIWKQWIVAEK